MKCSECGETFINKKRYRTHINEHIDQIPENKSWKIPVLEKELDKCREICEDCGKNFTNKFTLTRHLKSGKCQPMDCQVNELFNRIDDDKTILKYIDNLYSRLKDKSTVNYTQNNININGDLNTVININLVNLGDEKLDFKEDQIYQKVFDIIYQNDDLEKIPNELVNQAILTLFEKIHCNKNHPENHNIYVHNKKLHKPFYVYKADKWESEGNKKTLHDVIIDTKKIFINLLEYIIENNDQEDVTEALSCIKDTLEDIFENWLNCEKYDENLTNLISDIHRKVYEHRNLLGRTFSKTGGKIRNI